MTFPDNLNVALLIVFLLVGAATFISGMNMMSGGLKKAVGKGVKSFFKKTKDNRIACLGVGASVTAIIQSSAATSVMAIGFINAGVMSIAQGVSIMMGAYIGTTVTGILASLSSFPFSTYLMLFAFVGIVMSFFEKPKVKAFGEVFTGLGLLFFGLNVMSAVFKNPTINQAVQNVFLTIEFPILLFLLGVIFTALVQSSSATTGLVIALVASNAISFNNALYVILGANVGTLITTLLATIGGNTNTKRAGTVAMAIKIISAVIGFTVVWILDANNAIPDFSSNATFAAALFNLGFNLVFSLSLLPLVGPLSKLSIKLIKDKDQEKKKQYIKFIDPRLLKTPDVAMLQVEKEILNMMQLAYTNLQHGYDEIINQTGKYAKDIKEREDGIDFINNEVTNFLIQLSNKVSAEDEKTIGSFFHVINDIERIGDHADNFYDLSIKMIDNDLAFSDHAKEELKEMYDVITKMFDLSLHAFEKHDLSHLSELHDLENRSDELKRVLSAAHYERITKNLCKIELSPFYSTLVSELERIADHLVNVGYSFVNPTGDEE